MTSTGTETSQGFLDRLAAAGHSSEIPESSDVYGWLVGDWQLEVLHYKTVDVSTLALKGEAHFGWILEGRAIQDVWIMPRYSERDPNMPPSIAKTNNMYGTTLRVWDSTIRAWRIIWINPVTGHCEEQIGRRIGNEIVQIGARADGTPTRWRFVEITPNTFHWLGEALDKDGSTWNLEGEFRATRIR
jgi:hypothetical protein